MKTIVSEKSPEPKKIDTFPAIGVHTNHRKDKKVIVLFQTHRVGTVLYSDWNHQTVGEHRNEWATYCFTLFEGSVTLSN